MGIFMRYLIELSIIIPDSLYIFLPLREDFRRKSLKVRVISGVLIPAFVIMFAWVCSVEMLPVIPALVVSVMFLFVVLFFTVNVTLGRKLFCFFNAVMLGAFCLLYSILIMAGSEAENVLWKSTRLLSIESGFVSLGLSVIVGGVFFRMLAKELPMLLREEYVNGIWDFLFLLPLGGTILIWWMVPVYPNLLLIARARIIFLALLPLVPLVVLLIYYLLWWIASKSSESARLQQENTLLAMEGKRYEELRTYMNETRTLRHDFRQHILVITKMALAGKISELQNYLQQFSEPAEKSYTGYCENIAVDAVASYYTSYAERQGTRIKWRLNLPRELPIKEAEYCPMLGNLVENAMRAVKNLPEKHRKIIVISSQLSPAIIGLSVDNPYSGDIKFGENGLPETGREGHGIGLTSVMNTVRRYHGSLNIRTEGNVFSAEIILYCNLRG